MFTGIVQGVATIAEIQDHDAIRTFTLSFPEGFCEGLTIGASVSVDGVCLTATELLSPTSAKFDVILQSLAVTTLGDGSSQQTVNIERAARDGAEIGGHLLSGHVDFSSRIDSIRTLERNKVLRIGIPPPFRRYIFPKGYIAINGASLTVAECDKVEGWFEVWLIPETRRATVLDDKAAGDRLNIEIERNTQVVVDTVRDAVAEALGELKPMLEALLRERGVALEELVTPPALLPHHH
jgi:riboflavin synthase